MVTALLKLTILIKYLSIRCDQTVHDISTAGEMQRGGGLIILSTACSLLRHSVISLSASRKVSELRIETDCDPTLLTQCTIRNNHIIS
jgi:hypothetical protein